MRLYVGNGGPNLASSFHVIGEIFDKVNIEAGTAMNNNVQTTLIPAGGAITAEFKVDVPGNYIMVDHSIFRAFNKGALGMIAVDGPEDKTIYSGKVAENVYLPEGSAVQSISSSQPERKRAANKEEQMLYGKRVYEANCQACHQGSGEGIPGAFPPLADSDFLNEDIPRAIDVIVHGLKGPIKVNGQSFDSIMPAMQLPDEEVANVLTYVLNSWDNKGGEVSIEEVTERRADGETIIMDGSVH